jgi:hypothetical protein
MNSEGPDVIQAATINSASISVKAGFAGHVSAWNDNEIDYYARAVRMLEPTAPMIGMPTDDGNPEKGMRDAR